MPAATLIGPATPTTPTVASPAVFYKSTWSAPWTYAPDLQLGGLDMAVGSQGGDQATIQRRYGYLKHPWEPALSYHAPWGDAIGWWVQIGIIAPGALYQPLLVGRVAGAGADPQAGQAHGPSGGQQWLVAGPLSILDRLHISTSVWWSGGAEQTLGWVPDMNDRDKRGWMIGNRTDAKHGDTYLYGGDDVWTNFDYLEYVLARFVDDSALGGPAWTIAGQTDILKDLRHVVEMKAAQTALEVLRDLIPLRYGLDFTVRPTPSGFEVFVFAQADQPISFGPASLPANPYTFSLNLAADPTVARKHLAVSNELGYKRVRVIGKRIVVCTTLWASGTAPPWSTYANSLVPRWDTGRQVEYQDPTGNPGDPPEVLDLARKAEKFREVWQLFGAPSGWDLHGGDCSPGFDDLGNFQVGQNSPYQNLVRRTLSWTPLREQTDYTQNPPVSHAGSGVVPGFLPPAVWIASDLLRPDWYVPAEENGVGISAPQTDWGVLLHCDPNHWIAQGQFSGRTAKEPDLDCRRMVATIAFEIDARLSVYAEMPGATAADGVLEVSVNDAECWYLAPATVVGTDPTWSPASKLLTSPWQGIVLRNDNDRLCAVMCGLLARYYVSRARAEITWRGLCPLADLLGTILSALDDTGGRLWLGCPVTGLSWRVDERGNSSTTLKAGYAR